MFQIRAMAYESDENESPFDDENYEYADENENLQDMQGPMYDDDDDDDDDDDEDEERVAEEQYVKNNNRNHRDPSRASYADEMNLIDYVIEEEKEIGGTKGEDSQSMTGSTTYSR